MSKLQDLLTEKMDVLSPFVCLQTAYKKVAALRAEADKVVKQLKAREEELKTLIKDKLVKEKMSSTKTNMGTASNYTFSTVVVDDPEALKDWIGEDYPNRRYLLTESPCTKAKLAELAEEDEKDLPPGTKWYREVRVSIKK